MSIYISERRCVVIDPAWNNKTLAVLHVCCLFHRNTNQDCYDLRIYHVFSKSKNWILQNIDFSHSVQLSEALSCIKRLFTSNIHRLVLAKPPKIQPTVGQKNPDYTANIQDTPHVFQSLRPSQCPTQPRHNTNKDEKKPQYTLKENFPAHQRNRHSLYVTKPPGVHYSPRRI